MENKNNDESIDILLMDDLMTLIRPYCGLDQRIRGKIRQLTYRLNRLAQKQSLLIITGLIVSSRTRPSHLDPPGIRFDAFHADDYLLFQPVSPMERECIRLRILGKRSRETSNLNLQQWLGDGATLLSLGTKSLLTHG